MARPTKLNDPVRERTNEDGTTSTLTVAEVIVEAITAGAYFEHATAAAGVTTSTGYDWLKRGARAATAIAKGDTTRSKLGAMDRRCLEFSEAVERAEAQWAVGANIVLERLARGGIEQRTVTEKRDNNGALVERTTKTEATLPAAQVLEWRLERRFPDQYGRRQAIQHSGPGGGPIDIQVQVEQVYTVVVGILDDLDVALTDEVRQVIAARFRGMAAYAEALPAETHEGQLVEA